ncbi:MAG TPA: TIM barrel protein [bacterium]|nr:TIM barrel protein [bacterium]HOL95788.1 TIM barrel protein [bacterium]
MPSIRIANAPCSWGVLEFDLEGKAAGYAQVLDEMAASGYQGTELGDWGFMPTDPPVLRQELDRRGLALLGAFVPVALANPETLDEGVATALRVARLLAAAGESPFLVLADDNGKVDERTRNAGRVRPEQGLNSEQWKTFARGANHIARAVYDETGLRTVFHHHCAGYVETPAEIERFLELTDPDRIGLCFDTGHYTYGGGGALEGLKTHWDRIWHVHFKDCHPLVAAEARAQEWDYFAAVQHGVFCELGKGSVDFPAIVQELRARNYEGWIVVEQDVLPGMGTPLDSARRNRAYLQSLGL